MIDLTQEKELEHIVKNFHFLLRKPGVLVQEYKPADLASAILCACDIIHDPGVKHAFDFLMQLSGTVNHEAGTSGYMIVVRNYWGV